MSNLWETRSMRNGGIDYDLKWVELALAYHAASVNNQQMLCSANRIKVVNLWSKLSCHSQNGKKRERVQIRYDWLSASDRMHHMSERTGDEMTPDDKEPNDSRHLEAGKSERKWCEHEAGIIGSKTAHSDRFPGFSRYYRGLGLKTTRYPHISVGISRVES